MLIHTLTLNSPTAVGELESMLRDTAQHFSPGLSAVVYPLTSFPAFDSVPPYDSDEIASAGYCGHFGFAFDPKIRQRMLGYLLSVHLSGDVNGINWLLQELEIFPDNEAEKQDRSFQ